jgi:hypothetical protein
MKGQELAVEDLRSPADDGAGSPRPFSSGLLRAGEENPSISPRELHDHLGQLLTILNRELRNIERFCSSGCSFEEHLAETRKFAQEIMCAMRNASKEYAPGQGNSGPQPAPEVAVPQQRQHMNGSRNVQLL